MVKIIKPLIIFILVIILITAFFRNLICKALIEGGVAKFTELQASIDLVHLDLLKNSLRLQGVNVLNPPGFKDENLARAEEIFIKYDLLGCLTGNPHLYLLKLDITEINIIRNEQNLSNMGGFKKAFPRKESKKKNVSASNSAGAQDPKTTKQPPAKFMIDQLEFSIGKIAFINYRAGIGEPAVVIFKVKQPAVFKNVSDFNNVIKSVSLEGGLFGNLTTIIPAEVRKTTEAIKEKVGSIIPKRNE
ncbi:hypothetical protein ACFL1I_06745 [Candidatus Omnitrophota bacterium]